MTDTKKEHNDTTAVSFKDTLNLPRTDFPIRANAAVEDEQMLNRWKEEDLYTRAFEYNKGCEKFILHDGPPYANGHFHLGHAYNKILKDIVCKSQRMFGKHVPVTPGWDCHGLPIELKVTQEHPGITGSELKKKCRAYATQWINIQREEAKRLGIVMDWDRPYSTMDFSYEASIVRAFGEFYEQGFIEKKNKTVPWCASCHTVLASAEIEYNERKDPSVYVLFPLDTDAQQSIFGSLALAPVSLVIWTTTPWTLPLNRAVLVHPQTNYVVLEYNHAGIVVAEQLADRLCALLGIEKNIRARVSSTLLAGKRVRHPLIEALQVPLIADASVSLEDGTAFVHCAPGCGPEDYEVGLKNNLEIFSPVSPDGRYTVGIQPRELEGLSVADGQGWVITTLLDKGRLLHKASLKHPYPHCWRCRNGLIFRATSQWFCNLTEHNLKERALVAIDSLLMLPHGSTSRFKATLEGRLEWCLSRQRTWGVPIPAYSCLQCNATYTSKELIDATADHIAQEGIEYWDAVTIDKLLPAGHTCQQCGSTSFKKETDILDVWFESGVSHRAVLKGNDEQAFPASLYLEGKDQHRAWFQSSLLTSMVLENQPPMRAIVTHGFTVDEHGRKMSKSLGNVVAPQTMIDRLGTDGLRLWVSSINCEGEAVVSDTLMRNVQEVFRKIRNTCRFLLSNLYDFNYEIDALPLEELLPIDRYALEELYEMHERIMQAYAAFNFTAVFHELADYCAVELSAFYLDIIKDRLYVELPHGRARRSAQTTCWYILDALTKAMAPILSFTAEQISDHYQHDKKASIHLQSFAHMQDVWQLIGQLRASHSGFEEEIRLQGVPSGAYQARATIESTSFAVQLEKQWLLLKNIRAAVLKALEGLREQGVIKHSLEGRVTFSVQGTDEEKALFKRFLKHLSHLQTDAVAFFKEFFIVSQCTLVSDIQGLLESIHPGIYLRVERAQGVKCPRCWQWEETHHEQGLCQRCAAIVQELKK